MLEIAQNFEQIATRFSPIVLICPGLASVLVGLFIWLGGLGLRRLLVTIVGAVSGGICGFFITGRNITLAMLLAGLTAVIAVIFERIFILIITVGLTTVFALAILTGPYIYNAQTIGPLNPSEIQNQPTLLSVSQTIEIIETYANDFSAEIKQTFSQIQPYKWAIIAASVVFFMLAGFFLQRLTLALCCAVLGTILVFAGMISLLLYKGTLPVSRIYDRASFYAVVFVAMITFGTIEQLLLCPRPQKRPKPATKKGTSEPNEEPDKITVDWRTK